jgi:hypothetical protein
MIATRRARAGLAALAAMAALGTGCARGHEPAGVAAVVEGERIPAADVDALTDSYIAAKKAGDEDVLPRAQVAKLVVVYEIRLSLLEHLAAKMGIDEEPQSVFDSAADVIEPEKFTEIGMRKEDFARELRVNRLFKELALKLYPTVSVSDTALHEAYDQRAPGLERNWKVTAGIARFSAQDAAAQVRALVATGKTFDQAAVALGSDKTDQVEIDPLRNAFSPAALDAIGALKPGQISDPIRSGNWWLAVQAQSHQDLPKVTFDDVRAELTDIVTDKQRSALFQQWFDKQLAAAKVKVTSHYGKWNAKIMDVT